MLKAVLFDMDGVLVDSEVLHCEAAVMTLDNLGVKVSFDYCFGFVGSTTTHMMQTIIKDYNLKCTESELLTLYTKTKNQLIEEVGYDSIPYTKELITHLHSIGIKLAIASSSSLEDITYVTKTFGIYNYFDKIVSGAFIKNPKPAPDIYVMAANELGVNINECIVIEDSYNGVTSGKAAGMPVIGFVNKNSGNQDLSKADMLIEGFCEIDYNFINHVYGRFHNIPLTIKATERLLIKELCESDIPSLFSILDKPETKKYQLYLLPSLDSFIEVQKAYIYNIYKFYGYGLWGVYLKESNTLVGRCGIQNQIVYGKDEIELGYEIDPNYYGLGYGYESCKAIIEYAFNQLYITRIVARIHCDNIKSINLATKLGMKQESSMDNILLFSIIK
jgi:HAD superfamily hydrolase (TIGR01509 family)